MGEVGPWEVPKLNIELKAEGKRNFPKNNKKKLKENSLKKNSLNNNFKYNIVFSVSTR